MAEVFARFDRSPTGLSRPEAGLSRTSTGLAIPASEWGLELQEAAANGQDTSPRGSRTGPAQVDKSAEARLLEQGLYSATLFGSALANPRLTVPQKIFVTLEVPTSSRLVSAFTETVGTRHATPHRAARVRAQATARGGNSGCPQT
jgi:hypothetical protein